MRKNIIFFSLCLALTTGTLNAQVLLAKWTFPTGTATDSLADGGLPVNLTMAIYTEGGTSVIDFSKNGVTTKAAQATGWNDGALTKCWVVKLNTVGYKELKLSSKQQSGGNNPGPRDYKVQYRVGSSGEWSDVPNTVIITDNTWTSAVIDNIQLPDTCANRPLVFLRWIMTTNTNSTGGTVASTGINKIDDIYVTGNDIAATIQDIQQANTFSIYPNPASGPVTVTSSVEFINLEIIDINGNILYSDQTVKGHSAIVNFEFRGKGIYFIRIRTRSGETVTSKLLAG